MILEGFIGRTVLWRGGWLLIINGSFTGRDSLGDKDLSSGG